MPYIQASRESAFDVGVQSRSFFYQLKVNFTSIQKLIKNYLNSNDFRLISTPAM